MTTLISKEKPNTPQNASPSEVMVDRIRSYTPKIAAFALVAAFIRLKRSSYQIRVAAPITIRIITISPPGR